MNEYLSVHIWGNTTDAVAGLIKATTGLYCMKFIP